MSTIVAACVCASSEAAATQQASQFQKGTTTKHDRSATLEPRPVSMKPSNDAAQRSRPGHPEATATGPEAGAPDSGIGADRTVAW